MFARFLFLTFFCLANKAAAVRAIRVLTVCTSEDNSDENNISSGYKIAVVYRVSLLVETLPMSGQT